LENTGQHITCAFESHIMHSEKNVLAWTFSNREGKDQFSAILCRRPLWLAPYYLVEKHTCPIKLQNRHR